MYGESISEIKKVIQHLENNGSTASISKHPSYNLNWALVGRMYHDHRYVTTRDMLRPCSCVAHRDKHPSLSYFSRFDFKQAVIKAEEEVERANAAHSELTVRCYEGGMFDLNCYEGGMFDLKPCLLCNVSLNVLLFYSASLTPSEPSTRRRWPVQMLSQRYVQSCRSVGLCTRETSHGKLNLSKAMKWKEDAAPTGCSLQVVTKKRRYSVVEAKEN